MRVKVWPRLLRINQSETVTILTDEELSQHHEYNQGNLTTVCFRNPHHQLFFTVVLDVNRSLKRFPPGIDEADRPQLQDQLTRLIVRVLVARPGLHYYQGYHDVAITFLLVVGETVGVSQGPLLRGPGGLMRRGNCWIRGGQTLSPREPSQQT